MNRTTPRLLLAAALCASPAAFADELFNNMLKQALGSALKQAASQAAPVNASRPAAPVPARAAPAQAAQAFPWPVKAPGTHMTFQDGSPFYPEYIYDYWNQPNPDTRGATPSEDAPGHVIRKPLRYGGDLKERHAPELQRKLEAIFPRILAHPAFAGIRGSSLRPGGIIEKQLDGRLTGAVSLNVYPINLDDKDTQRFPDGTFHTPGEGEVFQVGINNIEALERRTPNGAWHGMTVLRGGYVLVVPNTDRPLYVKDSYGLNVVNPDLLDPTRPPTDIQFLTIYVGTASSTASEVVRQRVAPTSNLGRALGVAYTMDWQALLHEINAIK